MERSAFRRCARFSRIGATWRIGRGAPPRHENRESRSVAGYCLAMSSDNVELANEAVRRVNEAFRRVDDLSALARLWHPESRVTLAAGWPESGPLVGREAIVRQFERGFADLSENHFEGLEIAADSGEW